MPSFRVLKAGFIEGRSYSPDGKRAIYSSAKPPFGKKVPSWLEPIKESRANAKKIAKQKELEAEEAKSIELQKALENEAALFTGADSGKSGPVETL